MAEYIERETAQKILCGWCGVCQHPTLEDLEKCDDICPQFARIPNADVRPVVRGQWLKESRWTARCSECRFPVYPRDKHRFCPNCGAKMEVGNHGNG